MRARFYGVTWLGLAVLSGCALAPPPPLPPPPTPPARWQALPSDVQPAPDPQRLARWWAQWQEPLLTELIERALARNLDLRTAMARLNESRARAGLAAAGLAPSVSASASARRGAASAETGPGLTRNTFSTGFDARWEADLFGGIRQGIEAAEVEAGASEARLYAAQVSLVAEVARLYVDLRAAQERLRIAHGNLASQAETLRLTEWRAQAGLASALEVEQARASLEQTRAQIPALESTQGSSQNRLALLLGEPPGALDARLATPTPIPAAPLPLAIGIPAETLRQRPDVRAAELALVAETARLGQAEAARYPALTLGGSIGLEAMGLDGLGGANALARSVLASLTAPIFDGGRLRRQVEIQLAVRERAGIALEQAVLTALEEVESALLALARRREREAALGEASRAARAAAELARQRYASGLIDFQTVLTTERNVLALEDGLALARAETSQALIQLYKALGGGWSPSPTLGQATRPDA